MSIVLRFAGLRPVKGLRYKGEDREEGEDSKGA